MMNLFSRMLLRWALILFIDIFAIVIADDGIGGGLHNELFYEQPMFINTSTISITSITYNPSSHHSEWISRLFGDEAIFYNRSYSAKSPKPITSKERRDRTTIFHHSFRMPPEFLVPTCSIEMLGYAVVTEEPPLSFEQSTREPSIGYADLTFYNDETSVFNPQETVKTEKETWKCLYRAMYDNTGVYAKLKLRPHHYWPVFLYCPAPNHDASCLNLVSMYRNKYKKVLIDEINAKNPEEAAAAAAASTANNPNPKDLFQPDPSESNSRLRRQLLSKRNRRERRDKSLGNDNNNENRGGGKRTPYQRLIRSIQAISNLNVMGLRSFYAIPNYAISRKFIQESYKQIHGFTEVEYPKRPKFHQPSSHIFFPNVEGGNPKNSQKPLLPTVFLSAKLFFHLTTTTWELPIEIDLLNSVTKSRSEDLAVCATIPYLSSDDNKLTVNGAMIYEYIRYYTKLGYKIMLFDRNGKHYNAIFHSPYAKRFEEREQYASHYHYYDHPHVYYYNYTILQVLNGYPIDIRYENDIGLSPAVVYTDYDKRYTYSYCRFAFKHLYGIENVIINDFDEFVYCPAGGSDVIQQRNFQASYFQHIKQRGYEQLFMKQRVLVSKQPNMKECMQQQIAQASIAANPANHEEYEKMMNASIFHCLAPFKYAIKSFFDKTLHFGHYCPYTHYHYSSYLRYFDCFANTYLTATKKRRNYDIGGCSMIHLTTRPATYNRSHSYAMEEIREGVNELYSITNS